MSRNHTRNPGWDSGNHWVICDVCGFDYRLSEIKMRWDGLAVCDEDWEPRHPQDFLRGVADDSAAKGIVRTAPEDIFVERQCDTRTAVAGVAIAGCAIAGEPNTNAIPLPTFP